MKTTLFLLSITLLFVIVLFGWYVWYNEQDKAALRPTEQEISSTANEQVDEASPAMSSELVPASASPSSSLQLNPTETGIITGSLSFPSSEIPPMLVCAEHTTTGDSICTDERVEDPIYQNGIGYTLQVPAGTYQVYASLPNDPYRAYYSQYVTCGLSVDCPSHQPIAITVNAGETIQDVDPQDWYVPNQQ